MTRIVFHAYNAYVGRVTGPTSCAFWYDDPATLKWDQSLLVDVDLSRNVKNARASGAWADVDVDDHFVDGGLTTIGPLFPGGTMIGGAWLSDTYVASLPTKPKLPGHSYPYEFRAIVYDGDATFGSRRFQGFHARILNTQPLAGGGVISLVQLWTAGTARSSGPMGTFWLDLDAIAHPIAADATQVGPKGATDGALFLDTAMKNTFTTMSAPSSGITTFSGGSGGTGPKIPASSGFDY